MAGTDAHGAIYSLALPSEWNHNLVIFAHGGPSLVPAVGALHAIGYGSSAAVSLLTLGYALATTSYRNPYFDSPAYAEDLVAARAAFVAEFGAPAHTVLYGVSYGTHVATIAGQMYPAAWDGVVADDGDVAGTLARFYRLLDLRVVYQYYCQNLPAPSETQYPLWRGLDDGRVNFANAASVDSTIAFVQQRAAECTGVGVPASRRSPEQQRALRNILAVTAATEDDFLRAIAGASLSLHAFTRFQVKNLNAFSNAQARYRGSDDDRLLNRGVARYEADAAAFAAARALAPTGRMKIPMISTHPIHDRVNVEFEWVLGRIYREARNSDRLVQFFTDGTGHLPGPSDHAHHIRNSVATIQLMFDWVAQGTVPTDSLLLARCNALAAASATDVCALLIGYQPASIWTKIPREGRESAIEGPAPGVPRQGGGR